MTKLIIRPESQLPAIIEGLHKYIIIGTESLKAFQAKLRAIAKLRVIDKIPEAQAAKAATVMDAQKTSDNVLKAIAILGGLLAKIEPVYVPSSKGSHNEGWKGSKQQICSLPSGITHKESHQAQTIAAHPEIVEEVKTKI